VVANEIKELARQTSGATQDIRDRIEAIQSSTSAAMSDIDRIAGVIRTVNEIVPQMASAIEEQSVVTRDVAENIALATTGVAASNNQVLATAQVASGIASDIATISDSVAGVRVGSELVKDNSGRMSRLAGQLQEAVSDFKMCKGHPGKREDGIHDVDLLLPAKVAMGMGMGGYEAVENFG
jgi:methyl-accepting chemotaxis protein